MTEQIMLKLSKSNVPYIDFPGSGYISFVNWSKNNVGYKHLNFSIKGLSYLTDMKFNVFVQVGQTASGKKNGSKKYIKPLIPIFEKLVNSDGIFPYSNIEKLGKMINGIEFDSTEKVDIPIKRRGRKKKINIDEQINDTNEVKKHRGRPKKAKAEVVEKPKGKRGRPRKVKDETTQKPKGRRGRPRKAKAVIVKPKGRRGRPRKDKK